MRSPEWRRIALRKTSTTLAKIRPEWIISNDIKDEAASLRNITGSFIGRLLDDHERFITRLSSSELVKNVRQRHHTAVDVALAYCKSAAIAHQLVSLSGL
jgi:amidase